MPERVRVGLAQVAVLLGVLLLAVGIPLARAHRGPDTWHPVTPAEQLCRDVAAYRGETVDPTTCLPQPVGGSPTSSR